MTTNNHKGYGWAHQRTRKRLKHFHKDGTPCWWCGKPMYKNPLHNWDTKPLAADHPQPNGAKNHQLATRLLHFTCNSQRGNGHKDHQRPALQQNQKQNQQSKNKFTWK